MSRRTMLGAAAAGALSLFAISLALPLGGGAPEASAREILEKVQAASENPILAGIKSFHLVATSTGARREGNATTLTTEQWFVAPNKMRTETRGKQADGSSIILGFVHDGADVRHYASANARDAMVAGVFIAPVGAPPPSVLGGPDGGPPLPPSPGRPPEGAPAGPIGANPTDLRPGTSEERTVRVGLGVVPGAQGPAKPEAPGDVVFVRGERQAGPPGTPGAIDKQHMLVTTFACPEPERKAEATVAGRRVFVVEADMSACLPADAPDELRGRHVRWVDQQTFLPLKMEMYDAHGKLVDRYEVQSIDYDVSIPDATFSQLPAGTTVQEPKLLPFPKDGITPGVLPAGTPAGR